MFSYIQLEDRAKGLGLGGVGWRSVRVAVGLGWRVGGFSLEPLFEYKGWLPKRPGWLPKRPGSPLWQGGCWRRLPGGGPKTLGWLPKRPGSPLWRGGCRLRLLSIRGASRVPLTEL